MREFADVAGFLRAFETMPTAVREAGHRGLRKAAGAIQAEAGELGETLEISCADGEVVLGTDSEAAVDQELGRGVLPSAPLGKAAARQAEAAVQALAESIAAALTNSLPRWP